MPILSSELLTHHFAYDRDLDLVMHVTSIFRSRSIKARRAKQDCLSYEHFRYLGEHTLLIISCAYLDINLQS